MIYSDSTITLSTKDVTLFDLQDNFKKLYTGRIYTDNEDLKYIFSNTKGLSESSLPESLITTIKNICKKNTTSGYVILTQKDKALYPVDGACLSYNLMTIFSELGKKLGLEKAKELFSSIELSCIRINDANDVQQLKQEAEECKKDWKETELRLAEYDRISKEGDRLEIEVEKRREELKSKAYDDYRNAKKTFEKLWSEDERSRLAEYACIIKQGEEIEREEKEQIEKLNELMANQSVSTKKQFTLNEDEINVVLSKDSVSLDTNW